MVARAKNDPELSRYGPWLLGERPRLSNKSFRIGGQDIQNKPIRDGNRQSWKEVMASARGKVTSHPPFSRRGGSSDWSGREAMSRRPTHSFHEDGNGKNEQRSFVVDQGAMETDKGFAFDLNSIHDQVPGHGATSHGYDLSAHTLGGYH